MSHTGKSAKTDPPIDKPRQQSWLRFIGFAKRQIREYRTEQKKKKDAESPEERTARLTARATVWIASFTVVLALVSFFQWREMRGSGAQTDQLISLYGQQVSQLTKQAGAAETQTQLLRQEMEGIYGAVAVTNASLAPDNGLLISLYNTGHVMSPKVTFSLDVSRQKYPARTLVAQLRHFETEIIQVPPMLPGEQPQQQFIPVMPIAQEEYEMLNLPAPKYTIVLKGAVSYDTGFGRIIDEHVCWVYIHLPAQKRINETKAMIRCGGYEVAVANYRKQQRENEQKGPAPAN